MVEARTKEEEEKKRRIEQKMSQTDEKNDKVCIVIRGVNLSGSHYWI